MFAVGMSTFVKLLPLFLKNVAGPYDAISCEWATIMSCLPVLKKSANLTSGSVPSISLSVPENHCAVLSTNCPFSKLCTLSLFLFTLPSNGIVSLPAITMSSFAPSPSKSVINVSPTKFLFESAPAIGSTVDCSVGVV